MRRFLYAVIHRRMFNIIHNTWLLKADFVVRKDEAYRQTEFERRRRVDIGGDGLHVVAPEDLVLSKLLWAKGTDSGLQKNDARAIVDAVGDLDWAYLEKWAERLNLGDMLSELRTP